MSTLAVVEEFLRAVRRPVSVREIVEQTGERLPTKSKTPDTVVARDLSMDIKKKGDNSLFIRTAPGRYTMREYVMGPETQVPQSEQAPTPVMSVLDQERQGTRPAQGSTGMGQQQQAGGSPG